jgi:D-glycero-D-manno-heptose 1,7-bisphosphate phosphatase
MMLDIGRRYGVDLSLVPMASDSLRDLIAARAAGCEPHLVQTGRAALLDDEQLHAILQQVPGARVHADLGAFAEFLLRRDHVADSASGRLS